MPEDRNLLTKAIEEAHHHRIKLVDDYVLDRLIDIDPNQQQTLKNQTSSRVAIRRSTRIATDSYTHRFL